MMTNPRDETLSHACLPTLPFGYVAQPAWGFVDATGRFSYELYRVYAPPRILGIRGEVAQLDEAASFWVVTWAERSDGGDEHVAGRRVSYARARELLAKRLSFARFCSPSYMQHHLPALLLAGAEIGAPDESAGTMRNLAPAYMIIAVCAAALFGCGNTESHAATPPAKAPVAGAPDASPQLDTIFAATMPDGWRELRWGMSAPQVSAIMKRQKWARGSDPWQSIRKPDGLTILAPDGRFLVVAPQARFTCWSACGLEGASCVQAWFLDGKLVEVVAQAPHDIGSDAFVRRAAESYAANPQPMRARLIRLRGDAIADLSGIGESTSSERELLYWRGPATTAVIYESIADGRPQVAVWSAQAMPRMWAALLAKQADDKAAADRARKQLEDATRF